MRITCVISTMGSGGAEKVMAALTRHLVQKKHEVTLLTFDDGVAPPFFSIDPSVKRVPLSLLGGSSGIFSAITGNFHRIGALRRAIIDSNPDVVISFLVAVNTLVVPATIGLGVPVIVSERDDPWHPTDSAVWRMLRLLTYPFADKVIVHTDHSGKYFPFFMRSKVQTIPNPLMVPNYLRAKSDYKARRTVISIGRLTHQKGFDLLIEAFAQVEKKHPGYKLVILGEGPLQDDLQSLASSLGLQGKVNIEGPFKNIYEKLEESDFFVSASRFEGFGNVTCEAMACGLPIISAKTSGGTFILRNGQDGVMVPINNIQSLVQAMDELMSDQSRREELGRKALESVKRFRPENIFPIWEKLLEQSVS